MSAVNLKIEKLVNELQKLIGDVAFPVKFSYLFSPGEDHQFQVVFSNVNKNYKTDSTMDIYTIKPLMRILLDKSETMAEELVDEIFYDDQEAGDLCQVIDWNDYSRQIVLWHTSEMDNFDSSKFAKQVGECQESVFEIIRKIHFVCMGEYHQKVREGIKDAFV